MEKIQKIHYLNYVRKRIGPLPLALVCEASAVTNELKGIPSSRSSIGRLKPDIGKHPLGCSCHLYGARLIINYRTI